MLGSVNSSNQTNHISAIQLFNASNAFKNNSHANIIEPQEPFTTEGTNLNDSDSILKGQNIDEIRKYAELAGENNLTEDDIKYGLSYGRSVIVEYIA